MGEKRRKSRILVYKKSNIKLAVIFITGVFFIVFVSLIVKGFLVFKRSSYDATHRFTIAIFAPNGAEVISFAPKNNIISDVTINTGENKSELQRLLDIPIDATITTSENNQSDIAKKLTQFLLHYHSIQTNLTVVDIARMFLFARGVSNDQVTKKTIDKSADATFIDTTINALFVDSTLSSENMTIEIINGTGIPGLGTRLARLMAHIGGRVIFVKTSDSGEKTSSVMYSGEKSYTEERISKILKYKNTQSKNKGLADIIITIGKDKESAISF